MPAHFSLAKVRISHSLYFEVNSDAGMVLVWHFVNFFESQLNPKRFV